MGLIGFIISLVAGVFMIIGLVPFLGWTNWFLTLPASVLGAIFSGIAVNRYKSRIGMAGLVISIAVFIIAVIRLAIGGGFF